LYRMSIGVLLVPGVEIGSGRPTYFGERALR
jgi:hypothetical protein